MSGRRKGEEHPNEDNMGTQSLRSAKEKEKSLHPIVVGATAAAVAASAKLEKMVLAAEHTPNKGGHLAQNKAAVDRRSQGQSNLHTATTSTKTPTKKAQVSLVKNWRPQPPQNVRQKVSPP